MNDSEGYRDYTNAEDRVRNFYRLNHGHETLEFGRSKWEEYAALGKRRMGIGEACEYLDTLVDDC